MARKKATAEARFAEIVKELGVDKAQHFLSFLKIYTLKKKSTGTDPDPSAPEKTNEPPDNTIPSE